MNIKPDTKIIKIINFNYHTLPIFSRFGMCTGFGDMTIHDFANKYNVSIYLLIELINTFVNKNYLPNEQNLKKFKLSELINYLRKAHSDYRENLQHIENLLNNLLNNFAFEKNNIQLIIEFFNEYKQELLKHIDYEDKEIYPQIIELEKAYLTNPNSDLTFNYDLKKYLQEHINVEEKIVDIKNIIVRHLPTKSPSTLCYQLISEIYDFENDLIEHQRLEELILIPKALDLKNSK